MNDKKTPTPVSRSARSGRLACLVALALVVAAPASLLAEQFTATLVNPEGRPTTSPVRIHVDRYSTDAEVDKLAGILAEKGPDALREALWDLDIGYVRIGSGLGYPIAVARLQESGTGRTVRITMDRPISFREVASNARSLDYPFSYIELELDRDGKGEGQMFAAAKVRLEAGVRDIENYSSLPLKLLNVQVQ